MIGYLNYAIDRTWKPVASKEQFIQILKLPVVKQTINLLRQPGASKHTKQALKRRLPAFFFMGQTPDGREGSRKKDALKPTGLVMLDFDQEEGSAEELFEKFKQHCEDWLKLTLLVHRTPSGHGLRVVMTQPQSMTVEDVQSVIETAMGVKLDTACKDLSRLSYACLPEDIFLIKEGLFDNVHVLLSDSEKLSPNVHQHVTAGNQKETVGNQKETVGNEQGTADNQKTNSPTRDDEKSKQALLIAHCLEPWIDDTGNQPGNHNNLLLKVAGYMRYLHNDEQWLLENLPRYNQSDDEFRSTVHSAMQYELNKQMPKVLKQAIKTANEIAKAKAADKPENKPPELPHHLPPMIRLLVSNVPDHLKPAVAMSVFPAIGAHMGSVSFRYIDNKRHYPAFQSLLIARMSAGKSNINDPIDAIMEDIRRQDKIALDELKEWKRENQGKRATQNKDPQPTAMIRWLESNITNAALCHCLDNANPNGDYSGQFLYTRMNEIEMINKLADTSRSAKTISQDVVTIIQNAFDTAMHGQTRVSLESVSTKNPLKWNWNAASTIGRAKTFFGRGNVADGVLSRLQLCTIISPDDDRMPIIGDYDDVFRAHLKPFIDNLNEASGEVCCEQIDEFVSRLLKELDDRAADLCSEAFHELGKRALVMTFRRAMCLYIAHGNEWTDEMAEFVRWTLMYDMWCKMHFFGEQAEREIEAENSEACVVSKGNLFDMLPQAFTRDDVIRKRRELGMTGNANYCIRTWKCRNKVILKSDGKYYKA